MSLTRKELIEFFSTDEEIDAYHVGDDTVELCGYIDCVEGTQMLKTQYSSTPTELFKMYVSNGQNKKIKVVMWGKNSLKWAPKISEKSIIRIRRAKVSSYNRKFRELRDDTNCCTELTIQTNATIEFIHGTFESKTDNITTTSLPPPVTLLSEVSDTDGKIRVYGWIKVPFEIATCYGGSRGSGVIVDHEWRMRVHVPIFHDRPELVKGTRVYVDCQSNSKDGSILLCNNINDIVIVEEEKTLLENEVRRMGLKTPKRKAEEELVFDSAKK